MKTASEFAHEINERNKESMFKLTEDQQHWEAMQVVTADDLDRYLTISSYSDIFKELRGCRPRWISWDGTSTEEIKNRLQELYTELDALVADQYESSMQSVFGEDIFESQAQTLPDGHRCWTI